MDYEAMTNADHVKAFRLFELSRAKTDGKDFSLTDHEQEHLRACDECRDVLDLFQRQFETQVRHRAESSRRHLSTARFSTGEPVQIVAPGVHNGKRGVIADIIESRTGDFVYRYSVRLADGTTHIFFGFEIGRQAA